MKALALLFIVLIASASQVYPYGWVDTSVDGNDHCARHDVSQDLVIDIDGIEQLMVHVDSDDEVHFAVKTETDLTGITYAWSLESVSKPLSPKSVINPCWVDDSIKELWNDFQYAFGSDYTRNWLRWNWLSRAQWREWFETDWNTLDASTFEIDWSSLPITMPAYENWWSLLRQLILSSGWSLDWDLSVDADWDAFVNWSTGLTLDDIDINDFLPFRREWIRFIAYFRTISLVNFTAGTFEVNFDYVAPVTVDFSDFSYFYEDWEQEHWDKQLPNNETLWWVPQAAAIQTSNSKKFQNLVFKNVDQTTRSLTIPAKNLKPRYLYTFLVQATQTLNNGTKLVYQGRQQVTVAHLVPLINLEDYVRTSKVSYVAPKVVDYDSSFWVFYNFNDVDFGDFGTITKVDISVQLALQPVDYSSEDSKDDKDYEDEDRRILPSDNGNGNGNNGNGNGNGNGNNGNGNNNNGNGNGNGKANASVMVKFKGNQKSQYSQSSIPASLKGQVKFSNPQLYDDRLATVVIQVTFDSGVVLTGYNWVFLVGQYYQYWSFDCSTLSDTSSVAEFSFCAYKNAPKDWQFILTGNLAVETESQQPVCNDAYCNNHGTCSTKKGKLSCQCSSGFYGVTCSMDQTQYDQYQAQLTSQIGLLKKQKPTNAAQKNSLFQLLSLSSQSDASTSDQDAELALIISANVAIVETTDQITSLIQGVDSLNKKAGKSQKGGIKKLVQNIAMQLANVLGELDQFEQILETLVIKAQKVVAGQDATVQVTAPIIDNVQLASPSIVIPVASLDADATAVSVSVTAADVYEQDNAVGAVVSVTVSDTEGNPLQITGTATIEIPLTDESVTLETTQLVFIDETTGTQSTAGVTLISISDDGTLALGETTHFSSFTVTTKSNSPDQQMQTQDFDAQKTSSASTLIKAITFIGLLSAFII